MKRHPPSQGDSRFVIACLITVLSMGSAITYVSYAKDDDGGQSNISISQRKSNSGSNRSGSRSNSRSQQRSEQSSVDSDSQGGGDSTSQDGDSRNSEEHQSSQEEVDVIIQQLIEEKRQQQEREQQERQQDSEQADEESRASSGLSDHQRQLGCFTQDGSWTTDRSQCAQNQQSFHQEIIERLQETHEQTPLEIKLQERGGVSSEQGATPPADDAVAPTDAQVEVHIREQIKPIFVDETRIDEKRIALLVVIQETQTRLTLIQQSITLPEYEADYIARSIGWLQSGFDYFSAERSIGEIEEMAASVKEVLTNTTTIVATARAESGAESPKITTIVDRIEKLLDSVPAVIALLTDEGITVDEPTVMAYVDALQTFADVREECGADTAGCTRLSEVLDFIEIMRNGIEVAITEANRLDVWEKIEALSAE